MHVVYDFVPNDDDAEEGLRHRVGRRSTGTPNTFAVLECPFMTVHHVRWCIAAILREVGSKGTLRGLS